MNFAANTFIRILAAALVLSGCAAAPQHLSEQNKKQIKNVAIVSLVPENVNFDKIGMVSYSNRYTEFDLGSQVTDSILYVARQRIAQSDPDWNIKTVVYDRTALLAKVKSGFGFGSAPTRESFANLARDNGLDAIFVVRAAADDENNPRREFMSYDLSEGLNVVLKDNSLREDARLVFRANLSVAIVGKNGEVMALGTIPAKLDRVDKREPDDFDVSDDMKHNHRPEVLQKLGTEVIVDLSRRLNLCFDTLGFAGEAVPAVQHVNAAPPDMLKEPADQPAGQTAPASNSFDLCFSRCRQYTDRSKEQCFDACNK